MPPTWRTTTMTILIVAAVALLTLGALALTLAEWGEAMGIVKGGQHE
jgi:hypothetical protein